MNWFIHSLVIYLFSPVFMACTNAPQPTVTPISTPSKTDTVIAIHDMTTSRASHTATLLPNGRVLVAGGMEGAGATAELYDPVTESFVPAGRMLSERAGGHAAVLLANGTVLLLGGWSGQTVTASTELYDPRTRAFTATGSLNTPRSGYAATLLSTGKVLIAGGFNGSRRLETAELYDPRTGSFTFTGSMAEPRSEFAAALLPDGKVLVTGGNWSSGQVLASAEIFDPATGTFRRTGNMTTVRHKHAATALSDGRVLITGGSDARDGRGRYASAEMFDPMSGAFTAISDMNVQRFKIPHAVVLLRTGEVLVSGGDEQVEVYDPTTNTFRTADGSVGAGFSFSTATLLQSGHVLIAGGYDARIRPTAGAWVYRPKDGH